jgi:hypothetical protein
MGGADFRMQEELEHERFALLDSILQRVARGLSDENDARELARELGISRYWSNHEQLENTAVE